jgi:hypothetical protein
MTEKPLSYRNFAYAEKVIKKGLVFYHFTRLIVIVAFRAFLCNHIRNEGEGNGLFLEIIYYMGI